MSLTAVDLEDSNRLPLCTSHLRIQSLSLSHAELSHAELSTDYRDRALKERYNERVCREHKMAVAWLH